MASPDLITARELGNVLGIVARAAFNRGVFFEPTVRDFIVATKLSERAADFRLAFTCWRDDRLAEAWKRGQTIVRQPKTMADVRELVSCATTPPAMVAQELQRRRRSRVSKRRRK